MRILKHGGSTRSLAVALGLGAFALASTLGAQELTPSPNPVWNSTDQDPLFLIRSVTVDGRALSVTASESLQLPAHPDTTTFTYGPNPEASNIPLRFRCQLDGYEQEWHERWVLMRMIIRFIDASQRDIAEQSFDVQGSSPGWDGSFTNSPWVRRKEVLTVPADAVGFWVVISSAGPPSAVGAFAVRKLKVFTSEGDTNGINLIPPVTPQASQAAAEATKVPPAGWERGGLRPADARLLRYGPGAEVALAIVDDHPQGHADWTTAKMQGPELTPGEKLTGGWRFGLGIASAPKQLSS